MLIYFLNFNAYIFFTVDVSLIMDQIRRDLFTNVRFQWLERFWITFVLTS